MNKTKDKKKENKHYFLKFLFIFILIVSALILYSRFISTSGLNVKEYKITKEEIPDNFHGFKIVHISDIHYGRIIDKKRLEKIVNEINLTKPDLVVLTGDLIDRDTKMTTEIANEISSTLNEINATVGKYTIMGNHDYKFIEWETIIKDAGFNNLNDNYEEIYYKGYEPIVLAGLSTNTAKLNPIGINERYKVIENYLNELDSSDNEYKPQYKILLMHEPDYIDTINTSYFDLILAGHSHNGQVRLPFIGALFLPPDAKKYYDEYYKINDTDMYISSGIGTSVINFRFFNRPSINLYRLTNK